MRKLLIILLVWVVLLGSVGMAMDNSGPEVEGTVEVRVDNGDTLWTFIQDIDGRENFDGHDIISTIRELNDIEPTDHLQEGQVITIPKEVK